MTFTKPVPGEIDEWTHYLHGPDNNAVASDTVVGPPRRLQWQAGPKWTRHHDKMSTFSAMVSSGGRIFYIIDEGSMASIMFPPHWALIAMDAFNGKILWKRKMGPWFSNFKGLKVETVGTGSLSAASRLRRFLRRRPGIPSEPGKSCAIFWSRLAVATSS